MRRALLIALAALFVLGSVVVTAAGQPAPAIALLFLGIATASPLSLDSVIEPREKQRDQG